MDRVYVYFHVYSTQSKKFTGGKYGKPCTCKGIFSGLTGLLQPGFDALAAIRTMIDIKTLSCCDMYASCHDSSAASVVNKRQEEASAAYRELELELIQSQMAHKPMLRGEVGARAWRV